MHDDCRNTAGEAKRILCMCGAGLSVSAGIPDFRTPGTGLYSNLQKFDLPYPEAVFEINYFKRNPAPFFMLAKVEHLACQPVASADPSTVPLLRSVSVGTVLVHDEACLLLFQVHSSSVCLHSLVWMQEHLMLMSAVWGQSAKYCGAGMHSDMQLWSHKKSHKNAARSCCISEPVLLQS